MTFHFDLITFMIFLLCLTWLLLSFNKKFYSKISSNVHLFISILITIIAALNLYFRR